MASDAGFVQFVVEQIDLGDDLTCKRLFGEWGLWLHGKIVALVCDDQLLLKPTDAGRALLGGSPPEVAPYPEAKGWLLVEDLDDGEALAALLRATGAALPVGKVRKGRK
jgi:TfoX/Sxy family transcriptional regulator of competence genes